MVEFEGGAMGVAENSWAKHGGMDDRVEIYGTGGRRSMPICSMGNSAITYSQEGYGYAMEKAAPPRAGRSPCSRKRSTRAIPQELKHFIECIREDKQPLVTGEDGRAVLEIMMAAYESAGTGHKVKLPFRTKARKPVDLWLG